uniref:SCP domain-containing protein n=1 Tax=Poecilia reticulata TaxID=8081 RepID=A0A3P9NMJ8_POERE
RARVFGWRMMTLTLQPAMGSVNVCARALQVAPTSVYHRRGADQHKAHMLCSIELCISELQSSALLNAWSKIQYHLILSEQNCVICGCGENLYMASFKNVWSNAIQAWYNEVADFRYGVRSINGGAVGHYSQVIWATSKNIGNYNLTNPYKSGTSCGDCPSACDSKLCRLQPNCNDQQSSCPKPQQQWGCSHSDVASWSPTSCRCTTQIILKSHAL